LPQARTKVAILSGNPMVGRALELLLERAGYEVRLLEESEALRAKDLLAGVEVLILGRGLSSDRREIFLSALASTLETAAIPVLSLSPGSDVTSAGADRVVPWPCRMEDLAREIESALWLTGGGEPVDASPTLTEEAGA
jgi:DNA-binding response OmpR family regulator